MRQALPVADPWFTVETVDQGITRITEPHVARLWRANCFVIEGRDGAILVDTGMGVGDLRAVVAGITSRNLRLFTTHSHLDHVGGHGAFADCDILLHPAERLGLATPAGPVGLAYASLAPDRLAAYRAAGFDTQGLMVDAIPHAGYDVAAHAFPGHAPTRLVDEGDILDLGDRRFEVLHLPGHSPGSIALWEAASGTLVAGDAIYDGILIDTTDDANIPDYLHTMERLKRLAVRIVHGGHKGAFDRARLAQIADTYIASRTGAMRPPAELVSF